MMPPPDNPLTKSIYEALMETISMSSGSTCTLP
jgi:hypothetical protein